MNKCLPIVVIGQNYCTSLGIIKALGEAGYRVEVGKRVTGKPILYSPEMKSKYVDKAIYLHTGNDAEMINTIVQHFAVSDGKKILIPSDDYCVALIDRHLEELSQYFMFPHVKYEQGAASRLMDKSVQNAWAKKCGIKVANSVIIKVSQKEAAVIPEHTPYPCMTKPIESVGHPKSYIRKCENRDELTAHISRVAQEQECTLLVEQFIEIEKEYTIPGIAIGESVIIPAAIEKFRTGNGYHKGVTISGVVKNSDVLGEIVCKLKSFVGETGFQGIFDIELLQSKDGLFFNEINLRNGAAGYSLTKSGINLPAMYADYLLNHEREQLIEFTPGQTFVNEKAAMENYAGGFSSFRTLIKTITEADIKFILCANDIKSCFSFFLLPLDYAIRKLLR